MITQYCSAIYQIAPYVLPIDESDSKFSEYLENNKSAVQSAVTSKKQEEALEKKAEELGIKVEVKQDKIDKMVIQPKDTPEPTAEAKKNDKSSKSVIKTDLLF